MWRIASTSRSSEATGRLAGEEPLDLPLDVVVPLVDLVVERDHLVGELDVLCSSAFMAPRIARVARLPSSWNAASSSSSSWWNSVLIVSPIYPNRPVT